MKVQKGVAEKRLRPKYQFILTEKPSLGRGVAVSAFHRDCDRISEDKGDWGISGPHFFARQAAV